jgi:hypothetical protein
VQDLPIFPSLIVEHLKNAFAFAKNDRKKPPAGRRFFFLKRTKSFFKNSVRRPDRPTRMGPSIKDSDSTVCQVVPLQRE